MGKIWEVFAGKRAGSVYGLNFGSVDGGAASAAGATGDAAAAAAGGPGFNPIPVSSGPAPPTAPQPTQFETDMSAFTDLINAQNPQFLNANFGSITPAQQAAMTGSVGGIADRLQNIGASGIDPAFQRLAQAQVSQLSGQQQAQQAQQSQQMSRRGLGGSSADINAANAQAVQFGQQQQNVMAQLGAQGLQRADMATQQALAARNQQFGMTQQGVQSRNAAEEMRLQALTAGIQNASLPLALQTAQTAADKAGQSSGGGGGKK